MKVTVAFIVLASLMCLVYSASSEPVSCGGEYCREGECCAGGSYHRNCRSYGDPGDICQKPNKFNEYRTACPCKEGLICSVINRCQKV
uniref:Toxin 21 isoform e n=1 Tax=Cupiennius salei TaxID=6928 RepID=A0A4Y5UGS5_CUPSA|nr:toxin 21 isoform e precursor [Cupiennius salei]